MFLKIKSMLAVSIVAITITACQESKSDDSGKNLGFVAALVQTQNLNAANTSLANERNSQFILNGSWNTFTGNGTTSSTIVTISAKSSSNGVILNDSSAFGGFSSCSIVSLFDNTAGTYISQNPENNGACFAGDTNKGRFFKTIFFAEGTKYWTCTIFTPVATAAAANAIVDNTIRTNPGVSGCGNFAWSRLERR
jgi:hypothetical protein